MNERETNECFLVLKVSMIHTIRKCSCYVMWWFYFFCSFVLLCICISQSERRMIVCVACVTELLESSGYLGVPCGEFCSINLFYSGYSFNRQFSCCFSLGFPLSVGWSVLIDGAPRQCNLWTPSIKKERQKNETGKHEFERGFLFLFSFFRSRLLFFLILAWCSALVVRCLIVPGSVPWSCH